MSPATILVADDDRGIRTVLTQALARQGYDVRTTGNAATLWRWVSEGQGNLVITDVVMPDENGLDLLPRIRKTRPDLRVVVMSAQNTLMTAVRANERGAFDYLPKPFDLKDLLAIVERALAVPVASNIANDVEPSEEQLPLIGRSPAMQEIYRVMARLMPTDLTVMIAGESGTGKELVARALHEYGQAPQRSVRRRQHGRDPARADRVRIVRTRKGRLHRRHSARRRPFRAGPKAARCFSMKSATCRRKRRPACCVCCNRASFCRSADARRSRPTCASSRRTQPRPARADPPRIVREDLFYRLNVVPIRLPPLRERTEDIPALVRHFVAAAERDGLQGKTIEPAALDRLKSHAWPGNVRELENLVRRLCALYAQESIGVDVIESELTDLAPAPAPSVEARPNGEGLSGAVERHLREYFQAHAGGLPAAGIYDRVLTEVERPLITLTLAATRGNQIKAAELLGLNRNTLRKKIRELDIQVVRGLKYP